MSKGMTAEQAIGLLKHHIETWNAKFPKAHIESCETAIKALELVKRIKSLPTRTIETLEVGDYVEYKHYGIVCKSIMDMLQDIQYIEMIKSEPFELIRIIPHEVFELLKEVVNNENLNT